PTRSTSGLAGTPSGALHSFPIAPQAAKKMLFSGSQLPIPQIHREGDSHVSKAHEHCRRLRNDPSSARTWNRILRAWRAKGSGLVRRIRFPGHVGLLPSVVTIYRRARYTKLSSIIILQHRSV